MARAPGPNDLHLENGVIMPGLGADEPDDITKDDLLAKAKAQQARDEVLDKVAADLRIEAEKADTRQSLLDEREAELARRESRLRELEALAKTIEHE